MLGHIKTTTLTNHSKTFATEGVLWFSVRQYIVVPYYDNHAVSLYAMYCTVLLMTKENCRLKCVWLLMAFAGRQAIPTLCL